MGSVVFDSNQTGGRAVSIILNGNDYIGDIEHLATTGPPTFPVNTIWYLNLGDYVQLEVWQSSGASLNVIATSSYSPDFGMILVL